MKFTRMFNDFCGKAECCMLSHRPEKKVQPYLNVKLIKIELLIEKVLMTSFILCRCLRLHNKLTRLVTQESVIDWFTPKMSPHDNLKLIRDVYSMNIKITDRFKRITTLSCPHSNYLQSAERRFDKFLLSQDWQKHKNSSTFSILKCFASEGGKTTKI